MYCLWKGDEKVRIVKFIGKVKKCRRWVVPFIRRFLGSGQLSGMHLIMCVVADYMPFHYVTAAIQRRGRLQGAPKRRARGPGPSPWDLSSTRFLGFLPLNYVLCIFVACVPNIFPMCEHRASLQHGSGLTLGSYFAPYRPLQISARALPLRKSWVRPWTFGMVCRTRRQANRTSTDHNFPSIPKTMFFVFVLSEEWRSIGLGCSGSIWWPPWHWYN